MVDTTTKKEQAMAQPTTKLPVYNPATDGNRFTWILRAAAEARQKRAANLHEQWVGRETARVLAKVRQ
jgi:hypothetical protein